VKSTTFKITCSTRRSFRRSKAIRSFNRTRNKPLDDKRVRQALLTALDRDFIIDTITFGLGEASKSSITPRIPWAYNPKIDLTKTYAYDPDRANKMLDDAGLPKSGGKRFSVQLPFEVSRPGFQQFGEIVRSQWGAIGVDVQVQPLERQVMIQQVFMDWNFDATLQSYGTSGDPAIGIARLYVSSSIVKRAFVNASGYSNPQIDQLFDQGGQQATNEQRAPFYYQIQEILAEDVPTLMIYDNLGVDVASSNFQLIDTLWSYGYPYYGWEDVWKK
jgi:peptide/nickel transport system substrate-binding protein